MPLPDFFVIGAPKAGTTALHVALAQHPQVFMSRVKEPKHFLVDGPPPSGGGPVIARSGRKRSTPPGSACGAALRSAETAGGMATSSRR